jgi:tagaturonate reductase
MEKIAATINRLLDKGMPFFPPLGVVIGFAAAAYLRPLKPLVTYLFAYVTLIGAMGLTLGDFKKALKRPLVLLAVVAVSHVVVPVITALVANLAFPGQPDLVSGYVLLMSIPIAISCYIWSAIFRGNDAVVLTAILLDTMLGPVVTPFTVRVLAHTAVRIDTTGMMLSLLFMVVIPMIVGVTVNHVTKNAAKERFVPLGKPFSKVFLVVVICINSAQVAGKIDFTWGLVPITLLSVILCFVGFFLGYVTAKYVFHAGRDLQVSLCFTCGMRNISASLVLAINYFPPVASIPVIVGIIIQQTIAAASGYLFFRSKQPIK